MYIGRLGEGGPLASVAGLPLYPIDVVVQGLYLIPKIREQKVVMIMIGSITLTPIEVISLPASNGELRKRMGSRLTYFLINAGLLLLNLLFQALQSGSIRRSTISLQHLDVPIYFISAAMAKGTC